MRARLRAVGGAATGNEALGNLKDFHTDASLKRRRLVGCLDPSGCLPDASQVGWMLGSERLFLTLRR